MSESYKEFIIQSRVDNEQWRDEVSFDEDEQKEVITYANFLAERYADLNIEVRVILQKTVICELFRLNIGQKCTNEDRWGNGKYKLD